MYVRIGYFEYFKGADTILVCGDEEGLERFAEYLRDLEDENAASLNLHMLPFVQVYGGLSLIAYPVDRELGIRRAGSASNFVRRHSQDGWLETAEKIEVVAGSSGGHCYLGETATGDAVVMASKGEYGEAWWKRNGVPLESDG